MLSTKKQGIFIKTKITLFNNENNFDSTMRTMRGNNENNENKKHPMAQAPRNLNYLN